MLSVCHNSECPVPNVDAVVALVRTVRALLRWSTPDAPYAHSLAMLNAAPAIVLKDQIISSDLHKVNVILATRQ